MSVEVILDLLQYNQSVPVVGETYYCYDDGKRSRSRQYKVKILKVLPYDESSEMWKKTFKNKKEECYWLFADTTDYLVFGESYEDEEKIQIEVFARMKNGSWFGMGEIGMEDDYEPDGSDNSGLCLSCSGELDVDGKITKEMEEIYKQIKK